MKIEFALAVTLLQGAPSSTSVAPSSRPADESVILERIDLRGVPLSEACRLLSDQAGLNIVASEEAGVRPISLYLRNVGARAAVDALCKTHQLWVDEDRKTGILRLATVKEYRRDVTDFGDVQTEFFTLLYPNAFDVGTAIRSLFGSRVELETNENDIELYLDLAARLRRFDVFDTRSHGIGSSAFSQNGAFGTGFNGGINQQFLGGAGGIGNFGPAGSSNNGGLSSNEPRGDDAAVSQPPKKDLSADQIMELERLRASRETGGTGVGSIASEFREAVIYVAIARRQNKLVVRTRDAAALEQIRRIVEKLDVPTPLVLLEMRILSIDLVDGMNSFFEYQLGKDNFGGDFSTGAIQSAAPLGVGGGGIRAGDLIFQFVDQAFGARLQVLKRDNRVRQLATPVLLTANNEVSRLFVGREVPLNRSFSGGQIVANQATTATVAGTTNIEFRPVGTTLLITPSINADRTVTLRVLQEASDVNSTSTVLVPSDEGFTPQTVNVVSSQTVSGTIVAKSEKAVVFGGLIEERALDQDERVPILGDIPLLGLLFKRKQKEDSRREIVIMVRPIVLSTPAEAEAASRNLLDLIGIDPVRFRTLDRDINFEDANPSTRKPKFSVHGVDPEEK